MKGSLGSWLINTACGLLAYTGSRLIWKDSDSVLGNLWKELLTFAVLYVLMQILIRGRSLAKKGKEA